MSSEGFTSSIVNDSIFLLACRVFEHGKRIGTGQRAACGRVFTRYVFRIASLSFLHCTDPSHRATTLPLMLHPEASRAWCALQAAIALPHLCESTL